VILFSITGYNFYFGLYVHWYVVFVGNSQSTQGNRITDGTGNPIVSSKRLYMAVRSDAEDHTTLFQSFTAHAFFARIPAHCYLSWDSGRYSTAVDGADLDQCGMFHFDDCFVAGENLPATEISSG